MIFHTCSGACYQKIKNMPPDNTADERKPAAQALITSCFVCRIWTENKKREDKNMKQMKKNTICNNFHQQTQAGLSLLLFLFTVIWFPGTVRAADQLELNKPHPVTLEKNSDSLLYEFTVPEAGNISIKVKRTTPADSSEITVRLFDSDNLALTGNWTDSDVELPVYSTDKNRTFYIKIDGSYRINNTTYILTVNYQPAENWEK